jgi:hypothetical protein
MRFKDVKEIKEVTEKTAMETAMETEIDSLPDEIDDNWLIEHGWAEVSPSSKKGDDQLC